MAHKAWAGLIEGELRGPPPAEQAIAERTHEFYVQATAISAPLVEGETTRATPQRSRLLAFAGGVGLLIACAWPFARLGLERNGALSRWDFFARSPVLQQVSGYTALGCFALAMALPLRRRLRWLPGRRDLWRVLHACLGLLLAVTLVVHTSARLGHGLNRIVSLGALALVVAGGLLGLFWRRNPPQPRVVGRALRPMHTWLLWPALGLIAAHVLVVYYY